MSLGLKLGRYVMCAYREGEAIEGVFADDILMRGECRRMRKRNIEHAINSINLSKTKESKYCIFEAGGKTSIRVQIKYLLQDARFTMTFDFPKDHSWDHYKTGASDYFDQNIPNDAVMKTLYNLYMERLYKNIQDEQEKEEDKDDESNASSD